MKFNGHFLTHFVYGNLVLTWLSPTRVQEKHAKHAKEAVTACY